MKGNLSAMGKKVGISNKMVGERTGAKFAVRDIRFCDFHEPMSSYTRRYYTFYIGNFSVSK